MQDLRGKTLRTTFVHAPVSGSIDCAENALITIDADGVIADVLRLGFAGYDAALEGAKADGTLVTLEPGRLLLPGFVDLHLHAPQWPQLGRALDVPLETWLQQYTFPLEARYSDEAFAAAVYSELVEGLLANGTTTAVYFATIHQKATRILAETCLKRGQRAVIGRVAMDNPAQCPDFYRDADAKTAVSETERFIAFVRSMPGNEDGLIMPAVTPRFIPSCTDEALEGLGELAQKHACHVQTHCSESDWQHGYVHERYGCSDTEALDRFGLLTRHSVLAHCAFLSETDMDLIHERGGGVAHCPYSNFYFSNAVFPLRRALEKAVRVGLGTDISGGPSASMFDSCRHAIVASRALEEGVDPDLARDDRQRPNSRIDFRTALHLATAGGADVLDLPTGRFEKGMAFDAIVIDPANPAAPLPVAETVGNTEELAQAVVMLATRTNVERTFVAGQLRHGTPI
ncbi:guanine deaminase [Oricola sp.]|uniref:guanine deaminase n=1 Tax=Oricola sp. TaxID=1979950 RepID=UPI003BAA12C1